MTKHIPLVEMEAMAFHDHELIEIDTAHNEAHYHGYTATLPPVEARAGDRVRITARLNGHRFEIGQEVVLQVGGGEDNPDWYALADSDPIGYLIRADEFEAAQP